MWLKELFSSPMGMWVIMPLLIFLARIGDVSLGTIRIIFISRGNKIIAPILGFFEISIWLLAARQVLQNIDNPATFFAYAAGFSMGSLVGIWLEEKLAVGKIMLRIVTQQDATLLVDKLRRKGFGVTNIPAMGSRGPVNVIYTIIDRADLESAQHLLFRFNPKAFYTVEDIRSIREGVFPEKQSFFKGLVNRPPRFYRRARQVRKTFRRQLRK